jgi:hypothetical protein
MELAASTLEQNNAIRIIPRQSIISARQRQFILVVRSSLFIFYNLPATATLTFLGNTVPRWKFDGTE